MAKQLIEDIENDCIHRILNLDYKSLGINEYNLQYIFDILPKINYHFSIYKRCIDLLKTGKHKGTIVDFGGGHGFLSCFLKMLGFHVIYCDNNPLAISTVKKIGTALQTAPDIIIEGSTIELSAYCKTNNIIPDYLISIDVIEHIYDLEGLFSQLHDINPKMKMCFTTSANPCNFRHRKRLFKMMDEVERNFFLSMREEYISKHHPEFNKQDIQMLSLLSKGKIYDDITKMTNDYLLNGSLPQRLPSHNTCDPNSGSWIERILPLKTYKSIINAAGFAVSFSNGFYTINQQSSAKKIFFHTLNQILQHGGKPAMTIAPFIILKIKSKRVS
ncbi:methyltransferase domain-containing protein [Paludibacter sp.]|uniref:class I SAM-dependent methyltransferase n=1 Tax=Paludibacter sp. TaxID=1898105 RepID=UPI001353A6DB|nr:methyltransferase domain-containing protein [Paludibacter sp.]MTK52611.1 class I SAM-dependent methyltransferase [Paludibacter sp.]